MPSVNYFIDYSHILNTNYPKYLAELLIRGDTVTNISNYDERLAQLFLIKQVNPKVEVAIIGSSRGMLISNNFFQNEKILNNSVSGATIEDFVAVPQIYIEEGKFPEKMIFVIDPWIFDSFHSGNKWETLNFYYYSFIDEKSPLWIGLNQYSQLFSPSYFQKCIKHLLFDKREDFKLIKASQLNNKLITKIPDGSINYGKEYRELSEEESKQRANNYAKNKFSPSRPIFLLDDKKINLFEKRVESLLSKNIEIQFLFLPVHPIVYKAMVKEKSDEIKVEELLISYAKNKNISTYGTLNPISLGVKPIDFYDGIHCKRNVIHLILNNY